MLIPSHAFVAVSATCACIARAILTFGCRQWGATVGNSLAGFLTKEGRKVVEALLIPHEDIYAEIMRSRKGQTAPEGDGWQEVGEMGWGF